MFFIPAKDKWLKYTVLKNNFLCPGTYDPGVWRALHICDVWLQVVHGLLPWRQSGLQTAPDGCPRAVPERRWWSLLPEARWETQTHYRFVCVKDTYWPCYRDHFTIFAAFPVSLAQRSPNVALLVTSHGGHIGFLEGFFPYGEGYMDRVFSQFVRAAFEHQEDLKEACSVSEK